MMTAQNLDKWLNEESIDKLNMFAETFCDNFGFNQYEESRETLIGFIKNGFETFEDLIVCVNYFINSPEECEAILEGHRAIFEG